MGQVTEAERFEERTMKGERGTMTNQDTGTTALSREAKEALRLIQLIRKNPSSQSAQAEKKVLSSLGVNDYLSVIAALEIGAR